MVNITILDGTVSAKLHAVALYGRDISTSIVRDWFKDLEELAVVLEEWVPNAWVVHRDGLADNVEVIPLSAHDRS